MVNGHSFMLIRQMAALVRLALTEGSYEHCPSASSCYCYRDINS